ncbi:MAG TPA: hypothetical protein VHB25_14185 [Gemmatimonadaceae bacterium]|nr:hypothetical protein [Gemmatimonadaceae bacterium]
MLSRSLIAGALAVALGAPSASAQQGPPVPGVYSEYRADAIVGRHPAGELGAGVVLPVGIYVRTGFDAAAGAVWENGAPRAAARTDAIARFLLDPFREVPIGISVGGGLSLAYVDGDRVRPYVVAVVDIEGERHRGMAGITPALELGLGGGARIGVVLRRSPIRYR